MEPLVEVVPNFSEGRRLDVIDRMAAAIDGVRGAWLLDRNSDPDHGRSVVSLAGTPSGAVAAMEALVDLAVQHIDMRTHQGQHPRIGAVDVIPFVPLSGATIEDCAALARRLGRSIARRHGLPVYLYGAAAPRSRRLTLADIRRPGFEGLAEAMALPGGAPDYGPRLPHPTAGAVAVGARQALIAYNIQLATDDVLVARRIAARVRERDGGLPRVQALGLYLAREGHAQVSMNLLDHRTTPLWRVWEQVGQVAKAEGVAILDSELVGLLPESAIDAVADHIGLPLDRDAERRRRAAATWLRLRDYSADRLLEGRLASVQAAGPSGPREG